MDGEILQQIPQGHTNELFLGNTPQIDGKNRNFDGAFTLNFHKSTFKVSICRQATRKSRMTEIAQLREAANAKKGTKPKRDEEKV